MGAVLSMECERARVRVSLALDGELSQVEQALLRAHVGRCAVCAEFARGVDALTQELREAPLERPLQASVPVLRRRSGMRALQLGAAAAAVALAAGLGSVAGSLTPSQTTHLTRTTFGVAARALLSPARFHGRIPV